MLNHYQLRTLLLCMASIFSFSCATPEKFAKKFNTNPAIVPADFNPARHILLVAEMPRLNNPNQTNKVVTRKLDNALKEYCPYKYEIVSLKDIYNESKYEDTSVYKYAILNTLKSTWHTTTTTTTTTSSTGTSSMSVSPTARTTKIDFAFFDRVTARHYGNGGAASPRIDFAMAAFMKMIKKP